jgi:predicted MPP superfamily phosphohydrolase
MNDLFHILHLSDAHIGNPEFSLESNFVFDPLYKDLKLINAEHKIIPSIIIFSGDLAYGQIPKKKLTDQYSEVINLLTKITNCFDKEYGDIPIFAVPGNHDIDQTLIDDGQVLLRKNFNCDSVDKMMYDKDITWTRIVEKQKQWNDFANSIPNKKWITTTDSFFSTAIIEHFKIRIGIVGLNSAWASLKENDQGHLWIGKRQIEMGLKTIENTDFKIAVAHHPLEWLNQIEKSDILQMIESKFQIFLHGHEHSQWFTDSKGHLRAAAGACYTKSKNPKNYSWIHLNLAEKEAKIRLREYTNQGGGGWIANHIPNKTTTDGTADLFFLQINQPKQNTPKEIIKPYKPKPYPKSMIDFLKFLEDNYYLRWEPMNHDFSTKNPIIYWPVRLRQPTPIHATQCFVAAGLQKFGCIISLWIDDLGKKDYSEDLFIRQLEEWFIKTGGDKSKLTTRRFSEILNTDNKHIEPAWKMMQKWLGTMVYFTDQILKISKIWPSTESPENEDAEKVIQEFSKRRPARLMTPSMVWTCLSVLHQDDETRPLITLGGYDEQELWDAWRRCCNFPFMKVGHLYVSKITYKTNEVEHTLHMSDKPFVWESKEDIEIAFRSALRENDTINTWSQNRTMIPWTINNCVLLPNSITSNSKTFVINGKQINHLVDLMEYKPSEIFSDLINAVHSWLHSLWMGEHMRLLSPIVFHHY